MEWEDRVQRFGQTRPEQRLKSAAATADNDRENGSPDQSEDS